MKVTIEWLEEILGQKLDAEKLAHELTMAGLEVEGVDAVGDDTVLDIAITPNRGDCLSVIGLAADIAAIHGKRLNHPSLVVDISKAALGGASVQIESQELCTRYCGQIMEDVRIKESPAWMQRRLEACGVRAINNVVDITNYVMLEMGQPLHAFDADCLEGGGVHVRLAAAEEEIVTLDGNERRLTTQDLVIADDEGPVALAGVMGGLHSEVSDKTKRLFLESACFDPSSVRRTSKRLGLQSESSYRFERGIDWLRVRPALERMIELLTEHADAKCVDSISDVFAAPPAATQIDFDPEHVTRLLGGQWDEKAVEQPLRALGCELSKQTQAWQVTVPTRRHDLNEPVDLIEEVARITGYEQIKEDLPLRTTRVPAERNAAAIDREAKLRLVTLGFSECIHYSFCSQAELTKLGGRWLSLAPQLANPLSEETAYLRPTVMLSLLTSAHYHQSRQMNDLRLFELRTRYQLEAEQVEEKTFLSGLMCGKKQPQHWSRKAGGVDFYEAKGVVEALLNALGLVGWEWTPPEAGNPYEDFFHPGRCAQLNWAGRPVGIVGELHPEREQAFELKGPLYLFELDWQDLEGCTPEKISFQAIPSVPWVHRDIAVVVDESVRAEEVRAIIQAEDEKMVRNVLIFDVYSGDQISKGKKSLAFSYQIGSLERTLTDAEVEALQDKIIKSLKKKLQAEVR